MTELLINLLILFLVLALLLAIFTLIWHLCDVDDQDINKILQENEKKVDKKEK